VLVGHITTRYILTLAHKLSSKEPPPSNWLNLTSSDQIASVGKAPDGVIVLITLTDGARQSKKLKRKTSFV
jgi:hypothetical protein